MTNNVTLFCLVFSASLASLVSGYGTGAPGSDQICSDMTPKHGVDGQSTPSPYTLTLDKTEVKPGQEIQLTISGSSSNTTFKGFLVQGRKIGADGPTGPVGKFVAVKNSGESQGVNCNKIVGSSITHTNPSEKSFITLTWVAPETKGTFQLLTTIVQSGYTFWVAQPSQNINVV